MKSMAWVDRTAEEVPEPVEQVVLEGKYFGPAKKAWRRDLGTHQEISLEFFPGARPIWLWESN